MNVNSRIRTRCFVCREPILFIKPPKFGEIIKCNYCDEMLQVIQLDPLVVDLPWETESYMEDYLTEEDRGY